MFFRSGDGLPEPQTPPPAYTNYRSPVAEEWPDAPEDDSIYSGSPSPGTDEGSGIQGPGFSRKGKEFVGMADSAFRNGASDLRHRPKTPPPVLIAVMGKTGTGKTSFVNAVAGGELTVGDSLKACEYSLSINFPFVYLRDPPSDEAVGTQDIQTASTTINGREVQLIDTPGFDDTDRSDVDILSTIAKWVQQANYLRKHLSGIIYLHRISDIRMEGSSVKNLRMFRELCGEKNFSNVILCTTMWDKVGEDEGQRREEELKSTRTFWGSLIDRGAQVVRHQGDLTASARNIAELLIQKDTIVLQLQEDLDRNDSLSNTSAGRVLTGEMENMKRKHEEEIEALREEMKASSSDKAELELWKKNYEKEIERLNKVNNNLGKLRAKDVGRLGGRVKDLQRQLDNYDDLKELRAEDARHFNERLDVLQRKLDNSSGCIIC